MGISYKVVVRQRLMHGKMSEGHSGGHVESRSVGSFWGSTWRGWRHKRHEDKERKREEERSGLREGSYQTHRTISGASGHRQFEERDQEVERLCRLVRDLELEARGRRQRRDWDNWERRDGSVENRYGEGIQPIQFPSTPRSFLFTRITPTREPFTLLRITSTQEPFSFSRIASTSRPFTFVRVCWSGFRFPREAMALQRRYGCYEPRLTKIR